MKQEELELLKPESAEIYTLAETDPTPVDVIMLPSEPASVAVRGLRRGGRVVGMTKGQFSLIDLIRACLDLTGPADLTISTWTAGIRDAANVGFLQEKGYIRALRLLVDRSFPSRQPKYCDTILRVFGAESIRITNTHAKFAIIRNESWNLVIRSSMNLNRNRRFEQFDIDDSIEIADFFDGLIKEMESSQAAGLYVGGAEVERVFATAQGDTVTAVDDTPSNYLPF